MRLTFRRKFTDAFLLGRKVLDAAAKAGELTADARRARYAD